MEKRWSRKKRGTPQTAAEMAREEAVPARAPKVTVKRRMPPRPIEADPKPVRTRDVAPPKEAIQEMTPAAVDIRPEPQTRPPVSTASAPAAPPESVQVADTPPEQETPTEPAAPAVTTTIWDSIPTFEVRVKHLEKNRIITAERSDPAHSAFDVLRTKILRMLKENGWSRIAVTSPTEGCGKTFMSTNLALSLSRQANCRTVLMDLDMRRPTVAKVLGIDNPNSMGDFLRGDVGIPDLFRRAGQNEFKIGNNIAVAPNGRREDYASELMQLPETAEALDAMEAKLSPDVIIFDMPPALVNDDVLAARPLFDGVLLVVGGGITKPQQVRDVERRLGVETPLLGIVLNRSEGEAAQNYSY